MSIQRTTGAFAALLAAGEDPRNIVKMAHDEGLSQAHNHTVMRPLLKLATQLFDATGDTSVIANAYRVALRDTEKAASWGPTHETLVLCFTDAARAGEKQAAAVGNALEWAAGASALTGGGLGALYWLLNREATQDDPEAEQARGLRDYYRDLGAETKNRVKREYGDQASPDQAFDAAHKTIDAL